VSACEISGRPAVPFYGWRLREGERLARLAIKPGSTDEWLLVQAGWRLRHKLNRDYTLWSPPADLPEPRPVRTKLGPVVAIGGEPDVRPLDLFDRSSRP
jgi:hypothetical protein